MTETPAQLLIRDAAPPRSGASRIAPWRVLWLFALAISGAVSAGVGPADAFRLVPWPPGAASPSFVLRDAEGRPRSLHDYRGRVVVVFFGFLHCPDVCPTELYKLARVQRQLGAAARGVQVLFITLDPERDTPALLKAYVTTFNRRFEGLTGTAAQIEQTAARFAVQYARVPLGSDYTIDHSTATFVFDRQGRLRLVGALEASEADFVHDLRRLVGAAERGTAPQ